MSQSEATSRLLFHAINGSGLGHLSRQIAIAQVICDICSTTDILFLSESPYGPIMAPEFPFVNLLSTSQLRTRTWSSSGSCHLTLSLLSMVEALLTIYKPGAVIHDTMIWSPLFETAARIGIKQTTVLRMRKDLRDLLADPLSPIMQSDLLILPYDQDQATPILKALPDNCPATCLRGAYCYAAIISTGPSTYTARDWR